jgi:hypothetical protein
MSGRPRLDDKAVDDVDGMGPLANPCRHVLKHIEHRYFSVQLQPASEKLVYSNF